MSTISFKPGNSGNYSVNLQAFHLGVQSFRDNKLAMAIDLFRTCIDADPNNWDARMYLAMSLAKDDQTLAAIGHLKTISDWCPDPNQRQRANLALQALRA